MPNPILRRKWRSIISRWQSTEKTMKGWWKENNIVYSFLEAFFCEEQYRKSFTARCLLKDIMETSDLIGIISGSYLQLSNAK